MPNTPVTWLDEFFVTNEVSPQDPDIIQLANGNILVSWSSTDDAGAGTSSLSDVVGQIFDPLGNPVGAPIQLNFNYTVDNELNSDLTPLPGGGFIVVYQDNDVGGFTDLRLDEYDAAGNLVSSAPSIIEDGATGLPSYRNPHIAAASDTSALIVYEQTDASGTTVVGKFYDSTTNTYSSQQSLIGFALNVTDPDVTSLTNGNFVITATDVSGGDARIAYRIVSSTGANVLSASFIARTSADGFTDNEASVTALSGGGFVISYTDRDSSDTDVAYSVFNAVGTEIGSGLAGLNGGSITNDNNESAVAGLVDGSFVIVLDNDELNTMEVTHVSSSGSVLGTASFSGSGTEPAITDLGDGRFSVTWEDNAGGVKMEILDTRDLVNAFAAYTPEPNWQVGTIGNDIFTSDGDADIVHGHTGNDDITDGGLTEDNKFFGDAGTDILRVKTAIVGDRWDGGTNTDTINWLTAAVANGAIFDLAAGTAKQGANTEIMVGFENIVGSAFNDILRGTSGINVMTGGSGNDVIRGGAGGDNLNGGSGINTLDYTTSTAGVKIDITADTASGGHAQGDDIFNFQNVYGSGFNDVLVGSSSGNILRGYAGIDTLEGRGGNDNIYGHEGDDVLRGEAGNDNLWGDEGIDKLNGGAGTDALRGGDGADQFIFSNVSDSTVAASGRDTIYDFSRTQGDRINLNPIDANTDLVGNQAFKFIGSAGFNGEAGELRYGNSGGDTFISGDIDGDGLSDFRIVLDRDLKMISADFVL